MHIFIRKDANICKRFLVWVRTPKWVNQIDFFLKCGFMSERSEVNPGLRKRKSDFFALFWLVCFGTCAIYFLVLNIVLLICMAIFNHSYVFLIQTGLRPRMSKRKVIWMVKVWTQLPSPLKFFERNNQKK